MKNNTSLIKYSNLWTLAKSCRDFNEQLLYHDHDNDDDDDSLSWCIS